MLKEIIVILLFPIMIITIAELIVTLYSYLYVFLVLGSEMLHNPGAFQLSAHRMVADLKDFSKKHKHKMRMLVGKKRMQYQIDAEDAPPVLRILSQNVLDDPFYDACLCLGTPVEWVFRTISRQFEHYDVEE